MMRSFLNNSVFSRNNSFVACGQTFSLAFAAVVAVVIVCQTSPACADVLTTEYLSITGTGGAGGSGTSVPVSDMIFASYGSDGWGWAGGAGGVQGANAVHTYSNGSTSSITASNESFGFNIGTTIDSLNQTYGAGNWTVSNVKLTFWSSKSVQNNSRFAVGNGTFDIYWVANDSWGQSKGTAGASSSPNPIYATDQTTLNTWAGSSSLLASETYSTSDTANSSGYQFESYSLASDSSFVEDILSATSSSPYVSLYLMATSDTLGMIIFTGGQSQSTYPLPTLTFDVVSTTTVPEPTTIAMLLSGACALAFYGWRKNKTGK